MLAQLGSRVQHALRAYTPEDAAALRATVRTYPTSGYDLERVLQELGTGEAIVTVMSEKGAPTPVAWTRLRAPLGLMSPSAPEQIQATVAASPLLAGYAEAVDRESAREILTERMNAAAEVAAAADAAAEQAKIDAELAKQRAALDKAQADAERKAQKEYERLLKQSAGARSTRTARRADPSPIDRVLGSKATQSILREVIRGVFGTARR